MPVYNQTQTANCLIGRLEHDRDLLEELTSVARQENIRLARVEAIGAVKCARIGFYDQQKQEYLFHEINEPMEITCLTGNISIKDNEPMVHAHLTLADGAGHAFGGHLAPGTIVFACEFMIQPLQGPDLVRGLDRVTGLPLWRM